MIEIQKVSKSYGGVLALQELDLTIAKGEIFALLGPNGAGKTTTIKLLCGLLWPDSGAVRISGFDLKENPRQAKTQIGLIPDEPYVYPKLTGWEFLELIAGMYHLNGRWVSEAERHLNLFDLAGVARGRALLEGYSHGMKQKIVFTSILMRSPTVLLFDEPLVGLDPKSIRIVKELVIERARQGVAVFLSTHVLSVAEEIAHRIGILNFGHLDFVGTKPELAGYLRSKKIQFSGSDSLEEMFLKATLREGSS